MKPKFKFNKGDKVVVGSVKDASGVGYLGSLREVSEIKWSDKFQEPIYCTKSVLGTGWAWFCESELIGQEPINKKTRI